jgi:uncharacterized protein YndB with AHSA1/START domain
MYKLMEASKKTILTIESLVHAPVTQVWEYWTKPAHITQWNFASDEWCCPSATNDLRVGGKLISRMEAKDGSMGFDFWGVYDAIKENKYIAYTLGDDRKVEVTFTEKGNDTLITSSFEAESENPLELQQGGWQAILDNFKKYTEAN